MPDGTNKQGSRRRRLERLCFGFLVVCVMTVIIFSFLEAGARFIEKGVSPVSERGKNGPGISPCASLKQDEYQFFPFLMYRANPGLVGASGKAQTNSRGFHSPEFAPQKPEGVFRIIVLGSSAAWAAGAPPYEETFAGVAQSQLKSLLPGANVEVINASQAGYNSTQELLLLEFEALDYSPDLVLFFDGYNDLQMALLADENLQGGTYWDVPYNYYSMEKKIVALPLTWETSLLELMKKSHLMARVSAFLKGGDAEKGRRPLTLAERRKGGLAAIEKYRENLELAFAICKQSGVKAAVAVQPTLTIGKNISDQEEKFVAGRPDQQPLKLITELYPALVDAAKRAAQRHDALFWDLTPVFHDHPDPVYADSCNYNRKGHLIIGQELARRILPYLSDPSIKANPSY